MADDVCGVARCTWCGRPRVVVGDSLRRVFCRSPGCELAQQLLDLVLEEERSREPRVEFCVFVWRELELLTRRMGRGPQLVSQGACLPVGVAS